MSVNLGARSGSTPERGAPSTARRSARRSFAGGPEAPVVLTMGRTGRSLIAAVRIVTGLLWMHGAGWKNPARFAAHRGFFYDFMADAVTHEVLAPYAWVVRELVLPHFTLFAWAVWLTELLLGVFLLLGLATRFWALIGVVQSSVILLSVANTPNEWGWSYWMMVALHLLLFAIAAGRFGGLDGLLRPYWQGRDGRRWRLLVRAS
ncbi:MAG: TQO small subunit DoxD [Acidimicrobiia bacterium]